MHYLIHIAYTVHMIYASHIQCLMHTTHTQTEMVFSGIRLNVWTRSNERRFIPHRLCSRVKDDVPCGYQVLDWESILHGNA